MKIAFMASDLTHKEMDDSPIAEFLQKVFWPVEKIDFFRTAALVGNLVVGVDFRYKIAPWFYAFLDAFQCFFLISPGKCPNTFTIPSQ